LIDYGAGFGQINILKYLNNKGLKFSDMGISMAVINKNMRLAMYMYSKGVKVTKDGTEWAYSMKHF
jgi:hypothetical protein